MSKVRTEQASDKEPPKGLPSPGEATGRVYATEEDVPCFILRGLGAGRKA